MNCKQVNPAILLSYLKKELPVENIQEIHEHLGKCPACGGKLQEAQAILKQLQSGQTWEEPEKTEYHYTQKTGHLTVARDDGSSITENFLDRQETFQEFMEKQVRRAPWWLISLVLHGILIFLCTLIVIKKPPNDDSMKKIIEADVPPKQEPEYDPEVKRDIVEEKKDIPKTDVTATEKSEVVPLENVEVSDHFEADTDSDFQEMFDADPDNKLLADKSGDIGSFTGIGLGGGSGGAFGQRGRGGRRWLVKAGGGSQKTESAVDAALEWLKRHQSLLTDKNADDKEMGVWFTRFWDMECAENNGTFAEPSKFPGKCPHNYPPKGCGGMDPTKLIYQNPMESLAYDHAITGLALLTYAGAGYHHKRGKYKVPIQNAVNYALWAIRMENNDAAQFGQLKFKEMTEALKKTLENKHPLIKSREVGTESLNVNASRTPIYNHHCVALGLLEIYGVSRDSYLKEPCLAILRAAIRAQNAQGAWRYSYTSQDTDTSLSTWGIMVMKAGKSLGLMAEACKAEGKDEETLFKNMKDWLERMRCGDNRYGYTGPEAYAHQETPALGLADVAFLYSGDEMKKKMEPTVKALNTYMLTEGRNDHNFYLKLNHPEFVHENPITKTTDIPDNQWPKFNYPEGTKVQLETNTGTAEVDLAAFQNTPKYTYAYHYPQYYMTLALFQYGGNAWKVWNHINSRWLVAHQFQGKKQCCDGSWEMGFNKYQQVYGSVTGSTSLCALQLQVYYRYKRHADEKKTK